jgi:voltage-gated potassium channel Kch
VVSFLLTFVRLARAVARSWTDPEFRALVVVFVVLLASGTIFYAGVEGWSVLDALYFSVATMSTVGYGDFVPQTNVGKIFTIIYLLVGVGVFVALVGKLALAVIQKPDDAA